MFPTWAIILIVVVVILGFIFGMLHYYRPNIFRDSGQQKIATSEEYTQLPSHEAATATTGGSEKLLLGNILKKRTGLIESETIAAAT